LRAAVRQSLPEVDKIADESLRAKVIEVHALALSETEFERLEDIPEPEEGPGATPLRYGSQADHYRAVARMSMALADALESVYGPLGIDRDILVASALCHDVGKAFEFSRHNQARWKANPALSGFPAIRHPVYGVHLGLVVGLPESIVHCIGGHSLPGEGALIQASLETTIVKYCDHSFWKILERAWERRGAS
jgi:23S rRNA maturation-related 3'-5' exoribonuclease YhaM